MKRSWRDFLLTLCLAILIFTVVAFFLIRIAEGLMGDLFTKIGSDYEPETVETVTEEGNSAPVQGTPAPDANEDVTVTFLLIGADHKKTEADAIFLVGLNATQKKATVTLIPTNTVVPEGDAKYKLGELFSSRSANFYREFVAQETGITAAFYATLSVDGLANLIDFLGGIQYNVPYAMQCFDPEINFRVNLAAGNQTLNGDKAVQLVAYAKKGLTAREDVQLGFVQAFCRSFLVADNLSRAKAILYNLYYNVETDFEEVHLNELGEVIFNFSEYSATFERIPGKASGDFYAINASRAKALYEIYQ